MRTTSMWVASLLMFSPFLSAQQPVRQPSSQLPASVLGPQLVAWSDLQRPHPLSEPLPSEQADQSQPRPSAQQQQQPGADQAFTGTIVKDGSQFVLKTSSTSYQIDDQEKARPYEGKQVKIAGSLDIKANVVHVVSLEPLL